MNWDAISAIGEVIGAAGVIISLLYLALQIRHSSRTAEDSAIRDTFAAVGVQLSAMVESPNADVLLKGLVEYKSLSGKEKFVFDSLLGSLMVLVESSFISHEAHLMTDETMENWSCYLRPRLLAYPRVQDWWGETKDVYVPAAQQWVDRQIAIADLSSDFWGIE
jgi:hypothetical protein